MSTLLNKSYLVKVSTKGGQKYPKFCLRGLYTGIVFRFILGYMKILAGIFHIKNFVKDFREFSVRSKKFLEPT